MAVTAYHLWHDLSGRRRKSCLHQAPCGRRRRSRRQRSGVSGTTRSPPHRICSCRQQRPRGHDCIKTPVGDAGGHDGSEAVFQAQRGHRPIAFAAVASSAHEVMSASSPLWETPEATTAAKWCFRHNAVVGQRGSIRYAAVLTHSIRLHDPVLLHLAIQRRSRHRELIGDAGDVPLVPTQGFEQALPLVVGGQLRQRRSAFHRAR
jgi:hypothetical protein